VDTTLIIAIVLLIAAVLLLGGLVFALVAGGALWFLWRARQSRRAQEVEEAVAQVPAPPAPVQAPPSPLGPMPISSSIPDPGRFPGAFDHAGASPEQPTEAFSIEGMHRLFDDEESMEGETEVFTLDNQQMAMLVEDHEDDDDDMGYFADSD